jgi:hypothetical protein
MKILYAAGKFSSSKIQLQRFLEFNSGHQLKIAGFRFMNLDLDYTLDACENPSAANTFTQNGCFTFYKKQVKDFDPDLIISDMEVFTTQIAKQIYKPLWHYSNALLTFGLSKSDNFDVGKCSAYLQSFYRNHWVKERLRKMTLMTNMNLVPSHFGDFGLTLKKGFYWSRPYHKLATKELPTVPFVAATEKANKPMFYFLKQQDSAALLSPTTEIHDFRIINPTTVNSGNLIAASKIFVCDGNPYHAADAFYNNKFSVYFCDMAHTDSVELYSSLVGQRHFLGKLYHNPDRIEPDIHWNKSAFSTSQNPNICYVHEEIERWHKRYGKR